MKRATQSQSELAARCRILCTRSVMSPKQALNSLSAQALSAGASHEYVTTRARLRDPPARQRTLRGETPGESPGPSSSALRGEKAAAMATGERAGSRQGRGHGPQRRAGAGNCRGVYGQEAPAGDGAQAAGRPRVGMEHRRQCGPRLEGNAGGSAGQGRAGRGRRAPRGLLAPRGSLARRALALGLSPRGGTLPTNTPWRWPRYSGCGPARGGSRGPGRRHWP